MSDNKVSLLINRQVPEFVRDEYPLFITFLEAYYEYLETKQGTQINDLTTVSKKLKNLCLSITVAVADNELIDGISCIKILKICFKIS